MKVALALLCRHFVDREGHTSTVGRKWLRLLRLTIVVVILEVGFVVVIFSKFSLERWEKIMANLVFYS